MTQNWTVINKYRLIKKRFSQGIKALIDYVSIGIKYYYL